MQVLYRLTGPEGPFSPALSSSALAVTLALALATGAASLVGCGGNGAAGDGDAGDRDAGTDASGDAGDGGGGASPTLAYVVTTSDAVMSTFAVDSETGTLRYGGYQPVEGASSLRNVVVHPSRAFLYAVSVSDVHGFAIDGESGALTAINTLSTGANNAGAMTFSADGMVAWVADRTEDRLNVFGIDPATGELTDMGTKGTGENPVDLALHPEGGLLYSVNRDGGDISVFIVKNDSLGEPTTAYAESSGNPTAIAFASDGAHAYVTLGEDQDNVQYFGVDTGTGALTLLDTVSAGRQPADIAVDASGTYAYTADATDGSVTVFSLAAGTGAPTRLETVAAGGGPITVELGPGGGTLYVGNGGLDQVTIFAVSAGGHLSLVDGVRARGGVLALAFRAGSGTVSHGAEHVYVPHPDDEVVYRYDLSSASGGLAAVGSTPVGMRPSQLAFDPTGRYAYVVNGDSSDVYAFRVDPSTGELTGNGVSSIGGFADMLLTRLAVDPSGRFLYVLDNRQGLGNPGRLFLFDIGEDGTITYNSAINGPNAIGSGGDNPENLLIHPNGRFMYVMNSYGDNVALFRLDPDDGRPSLTDTLPGLDRALHAAIHPNGRWLYLTVQNEHTLYRYYINDGSGSLTGGQAVTQASDPSAETSHVAVHPSGDWLYLTARDDTVSWYAVDRSSGSLTFTGKIDVSPGPEWLALTPDGRHAYGVSTDGVQRFSIDAATGAIRHDGLTELSNLGTFQRTLTLDDVRR